MLCSASPIRVAGINYDVALSFGVEVGSSRSVSSRLGSALVAADEADGEALKWKFHDPARLQEVPWRLSLLSQLDTAIDDGQVWIAYQPKLDLATRRTVGAEALARWTHPEKGSDQPDRIRHRRRAKRPDRKTDRLRARPGNRRNRGNWCARATTSELRSICRRAC